MILRPPGPLDSSTYASASTACLSKHAGRAEAGTPPEAGYGYGCGCRLNWMKPGCGFKFPSGPDSVKSPPT